MTDRIRVGPLLVTNTTIDDAAQYAIQLASSRSTGSTPTLLTSVNAQAVLLAQQSSRFAQILNDSALSIADGMSIVLASRFLGTPLKDRVAGVDLVEAICERCATQGLKPYFVGGQPGAAAKTADRLCRRYPALRIAGFDCPPYGFESDDAKNRAVLDAINDASPDFLFLALGTPKQEYWAAHNLDELNSGVVVPVGAAFEMLAGVVPRAPRWLQSLGMEWLFRLILEPRRLWRRYLLGNPRFVTLIVQQYLELRRSARAAERMSSETSAEPD